MKNRLLPSERGFALALALVYITIITALIASALTLVLREYEMMKADAGRVQALYAAEAGVEIGLYELNNVRTDAAWSGWIRDGHTFRLVQFPETLTSDRVPRAAVTVTVNTDTLTIASQGRVSVPLSTEGITCTVTAEVRRDGRICTLRHWRTE